MRTGGQLSSVYGLQAPMAGAGVIGSKYGAANIKRWRKKFTLYYVYYVLTQISSGSIVNVLETCLFLLYIPYKKLEALCERVSIFEGGVGVRVQMGKSLAFLVGNVGSDMMFDKFCDLLFFASWF